MNYLISIKTAIFIFPIIAILITIPFILWQYHKYGSIHPLRVMIIYLFVLYLLCAYFLVILPLPSRESVLQNPKWMSRLIPFFFLLDIIRESPLKLTDPTTYLKTITEPSVYIVVFNILLFIPFGMFLRYYLNTSWKKTLWYSFLLSLFFELTQLSGLYFIYPRPYRLFDVDDLILNTTGGMIGFVIMKQLARFFPTRETLDQWSYERGEKVSGLRRVTLFFLDIILYLIFYLLCKKVGKKHPFLISFGIYFVLLPYLWKGSTLGGKFLNVRLDISSKKLMKLFLRAIFVFSYYFLLPHYFLKIASIIGGEEPFFYLLLFLLVLLFYNINLLLVLKNKKMFYDQLLKTSYQSTIRRNKEEQNITKL